MTIKNPKITIIVPFYNAADYLEECLKSLKNQTYKNLEIVLINDGSTDGSKSIAEKFAKSDSRIKLYNRKNAGVSAARNFGLEKATGDFVSFVDADDFLELNFCSALLDFALKSNSPYIASGYHRLIGASIENINANDSLETLTPSEFAEKIWNVQTGYGFCHMKLIDQKILKNVRFDESLKVAEDALFNLELMQNLEPKIKTQKPPVLLVNQPLYFYRLNPNSVVKKYDPNYVKKYQKSMEAISKKIAIKKSETKKSKFEKIAKTNLPNFIMYHFLLILVNYCAHPKNKSKLKSLKSAAKIPIFENAIKNSNYENLSLTRKIPLFFLKHNFFRLALLIGRVRQLQFKKS